MAMGAERRQVDVVIGQQALPLGRLGWLRQGGREFSTLAYAPSWLSSPERFEVSPDLPLTGAHQVRRAPTREDSVFHHALADTEPDAWGRRVIARAHARSCQRDPSIGPLTAFDTLAAVDDYCRVGALRLRDDEGQFLGSFEGGAGRTPPLIELAKLYEATRAVEAGSDSAADLRYLQGRGTSLGGQRPKCSVIDHDGALAIGKFPSQHDQRPVERAEVLTLRLATLAGIETAPARIEVVQGTAVAVIRRFDRAAGESRIPYLSAASMLQARRDEDRSYFELADALRARGAQPGPDLAQLWRRLVFNLLVTNVDDHLQNTGFLHVGRGLWRLAPAFDLNPFPDKLRESKTWLGEALGPITSVEMLLGHADYFGLDAAAARQVLSAVAGAVRRWRSVGRRKGVGLTPRQLDEIAPAFEHAQAKAAASALA